ncbi:MAG: hypothetical protein ACRYG2_16615, partial [Janthinobacterium lividum]
RPGLPVVLVGDAPAPRHLLDAVAGEAGPEPRGPGPTCPRTLPPRWAPVRRHAGQGWNALKAAS